MLNQVAPEPTDVELRASARMTKNGGDNTTSSTRRVPVQLRALTGKQLYCRYWVPSDPPRALVLILHGFAEHVSCYEELANRLALEGPFLAYGHDHVGHGLSEGPRAHVDSFDEYVVDALQHARLMQAEYPQLPTFAVGHSMGGMILLAAALREPLSFTGVVLMGPLIYIDPAAFTPFKVWGIGVLSRILPQLVVEPLDFNLVTRDKNELERSQEDPLIWKGGIKCKWAKAIHDGLVEMNKHLLSMKVPFLLLHGEMDRICNPKGSQMLFDQAPVQDKTFKRFPSAFHNLFRELPEVRNEALADTVRWIIDRIPTVELH